MENKFSLEFSFSQEDVNAFAAVTGDNNPIHLDEAYAAQTIFKRRIVHGMLGASVLSKIFGTRYPGEGTIYLKQNLTFLSPMYTDIVYTAFVEVVEVISEKARARVRTHISDASGTIVIDGEALIKNKIYG